MHGMEKFIT